MTGVLEIFIEEDLGPVSLTVFCSQFNFDGNFTLLLFSHWSSDRNNFAHATTAQLSCHVQNLVAIIVSESKWEQNEISIEFDLRWKKTFKEWAPGYVYPTIVVDQLEM